MTNKKYKHGIAVMRLQPLHIGHVKLIERMFDECETITILVGSAQYSRQEKTPFHQANPFTYVERKMMLQEVFHAFPIHIIPLADINAPALWAKHVIGTVVLERPTAPIPDAYYGGTEESTKLFKNFKLNVTEVGRDDEVSGTQIRKLFYTDNWYTLVPSGAYSIILDYLQEKNANLPRE